jgi:glycosyltransferase involved in cell wall biosynthesis
VALRKRKTWGIKDDTFLIVFAGNVAAACGIESVIRSVSEFGSGSGVELVIAGSGSALDSCRNIAEQYGEGRVKFCGRFMAEETLAILSAADVLVLPTQGDQSLVSMPSKLISYMMAARPILAIARSGSDLAMIVNEAGCGWVVEPGDGEQFARQLRIIISLDRSKLTHMGAMGRKYALACFSTEACLSKLVAAVENLLGTKEC